MFEINNIEKTFEKPFSYSFSLTAKITLKLYIVSANWREKELNRPVWKDNSVR